MGRALFCVVTVLGLVAGARAVTPPRGILGGRIVDAVSVAPIEGATVIVRAAGAAPVVMTTHTVTDGHFGFELPPGRYDLLAVYGDARWGRGDVEVLDGKTTLVAGVLAVAAESITIHEHLPPTQEPKQAAADRSTVKKLLPYTDEAIDSDAWEVGWVLLAVDEIGAVRSFRWLNRPGHGLAAIAEKELFLLRFRPAEDHLGRKVASQVLWKVEWPAFSYAKNVTGYNGSGPGGTMPSMQLDDIYGQKDRVGARHGGKLPLAPTNDPMDSLSENFILPGGTSLPPCKGQAPINHENYVITYRDCSGPDLSKLSTEKPVLPPAK